MIKRETSTVDDQRTSLTCAIIILKPCVLDMRRTMNLGMIPSTLHDTRSPARPKTTQKPSIFRRNTFFRAKLASCPGMETEMCWCKEHV